MTHCINLNQNNGSVVAHWYPALWEKTEPILSPLVGLTHIRMYVWQAGRWVGGCEGGKADGQEGGLAGGGQVGKQVVRWADEICVDFEIFKILYR